MQILDGDGIDATARTRFLATQADARCYHAPAWLNALTEGFGYRDSTRYAVSDGDLVGLLPMVRRRGLRGQNECVALPFSHQVPLLACDASVIARLTEAALDLAPRLVVRDAVDSATSGQRIDSGSVTAWVDLRGGYKEVSQRFSSMARRGVRKAVQERIEVALATDADAVDQFYELLIETRRRQGVPIYPRGFLHAVRRHFGPDASRLWLARDQGCVVAGLWLLLFQGHVLYAFGASRSASDGLRKRPNNLLFDRVIASLCDEGYPTFDLGSAHRDNAGLIAFKQGWGAQLAPVAWRVWPEQCEFQPIARTGALVSAASAALRKMPLPLYLRLSALLIGRVG
jgi:CelD/BcsL family acetyltransferase involved in cellulose biosynthesis